VATYFESLRDNIDTAFALPVAGIHVDLVRGADQLDAVISLKAGDKVLSLGVIDGRNIWKNDLSASIQKIEKAVQKLGHGQGFRCAELLAHSQPGRSRQ
jgi:5-methyltetrahydropteroyltriglutamate--homocysteine methyltransferase